MAYKNSHIFLPLVQKARKKHSLDKLLAGRGEWFVVQRDMFGDFPERPTDIDSIFIFGINKLCKQGDTSIAKETEDAIVAICDQPYVDDAYLAGQALYTYLSFSRNGHPPFQMNIERIVKSIKACIIRDKEKMLKTHKWVYTYSNTNGPKDLYHFMQMQNDIFLPLGVNLFDDSVFEYESPSEIAEILKTRDKEKELIVDFDTGEVVSCVIDEIYKDYDYIGTTDHPVYKVTDRCDIVVSEVLRGGENEFSTCQILDLTKHHVPYRIMDSCGRIVYGPAASVKESAKLLIKRLVLSIIRLLSMVIGYFRR